MQWLPVAAGSHIGHSSPSTTVHASYVLACILNASYVLADSTHVMAAISWLI